MEKILFGLGGMYRNGSDIWDTAKNKVKNLIKNTEAKLWKKAILLDK